MPEKIEIWNHHIGYHQAIQDVLNQSVEQDLALLDLLFGRDELHQVATGEEVKQEALRQLEIEWRSERNHLAECMVAAYGWPNKEAAI
jgi:hypothetical protein